MAVAVSLLFSTPSIAAQPDHDSTDGPGSFVVPGKIIVKLTPEFVDGPAADVVALAAGGRIERRSRYIRGLTIVEVEPGTEFDALESCAAMPWVEYAVPNRHVPIRLAEAPSQLATPNDPAYVAGQQWYLDRIGMPQAWNVRTDASGVIVCIMDTGAQYPWPDLNGNMWINEAERYGITGVDDDENEYCDDIWGVGGDLNETECTGLPVLPGSHNHNDPLDVPSFAVTSLCESYDELPRPSTCPPFGHDLTKVCYHGTGMAAIIGAIGNDGFGMTGIAWQARILPIRVVNACYGPDNAELIRVFDYFFESGAQILDLAWTGTTHSSVMWEVFKVTHDMNRLVVVSAGNSGLDMDAPGVQVGPPQSYPWPNILVVGASDQNDNRSIWGPTSSSNYGILTVDLFAPGSCIRIPAPGDASTPGVGRFTNGTSFASPVVAGVAALVWAEHPTWTAAQVAEHLVVTARPVPALQGLCKSGGVVDAAKALTGVPTNVPASPVCPCAFGGGATCP